MIYFIQAENGGPIKIGFTRDLDRRLDRLQTGSPYPLNVLATIDTGCDDVHDDASYERMIHDKFQQYRLRREWFEPSKELLEFISDVRTKGQSILIDIKREWLEKRNQRWEQNKLQRRTAFLEQKKLVEEAKQAWGVNV
jgi:hypothetical protein